jgi:DNA replication protein DnaD
VSKGWIKLHRKLLDSDMWTSLNCVQRELMIILLLLVNHKSNQWEWKGQIFNVQPGQCITSIENLRKKMAIKTSTKQVRDGLHKLKKWGFLSEETSNTGRLITIVNWNTYQSISDHEGQGFGQTGGKRRATNKNGENELRKEGIYEKENSGQFPTTSDSAQKEIERVRRRMGDN